MKRTYKIFEKIGVFCYLFCFYQLWHLCQFGGLQRHVLRLGVGVLALLISVLAWLLLKKKDSDLDVKKGNHGTQTNLQKKNPILRFRADVWIVIIATIYFSGRILYSAIPYNGALSWKIDEWLSQKEVRLEHDNIFEDGVEGILADLDEALDLPEELYIVNKFQVTFDENGTIQTIDTFFYGKDETGETKTYLVDYDAEKSTDMTVWINGNANTGYDETMGLTPMLRILENADYEGQINVWSDMYDSAVYEIVYFGHRSFSSADGLHYIVGDVDGDGVISGITNFDILKNGGEVAGFEVSLHIPQEPDMTPIRYMMEPEYISPQQIMQEQQAEQMDDAKEKDSWTVDKSDGSMYFFLDETMGWRMVVTDAVAGSRYYELEQTMDGGLTWTNINRNPFDGNLGVTEGLLFFDENFGFAGLTGASQSYSQMYMTMDGGVTFTKVELPMDTVTELPEYAIEYGFTITDFDYICMPEKVEDILRIQVTTEAAETDGIWFQSQYDGKTWKILY